MEQTYFEKINSQSKELFDEIRETLRNSCDVSLSSRVQEVPTTLYDKDKCINVAFAGQYSAGKSSLLTILTGKQLAVGGGITTSDCQTFEWEGINVTDTPGIHTQNRPDHDAITYEQLAKADLIVFVLTAEGFSDHLANHFRTLINEKGKGREMMLVINKMDRTAGGNTPEQQEVLLNKDILPVIEPYVAEDMYTTFISTYWYDQAFVPKYANYKDKLIAKSGILDFVANLNRFVADKGLLGSYTTSLYEVEKMLFDIVSGMKTGDAIVDGAIHLLNEKRRIFEDAKMRIKEKTAMIVGECVCEIQEWGNDIANSLSSRDKQDDVNAMLAEKQAAVDERAEKLMSEIEALLNVEVEALKQRFNDFESMEFVKEFRCRMEDKIKKMNISDGTKRNLEQTGGYIRDIGNWIVNQSVGKNRAAGFSSIFKTSIYSGSKLHDSVLKIGHFFGHKFKPWQAVRWTKNVTNCSRILGVAGSVLSVALQIYNDRQEDKVEAQLAVGRSEIRTCFRDVSNVIDMEYDKVTDTWLQENITPYVEQIDHEIEVINNNIQLCNDLYLKLSDLLQRVRRLITEIQTV